MTLTYEDALQQVLEAIQAGKDIEAAIARFPEHAAALRLCVWGTRICFRPTIHCGFPTIYTCWRRTRITCWPWTPWRNPATATRARR